MFGGQGSGSFVEAGARGVADAALRFGCAVETHFCEALDHRSREHRIELVAGTKPSLVVVHGGQGSEPLSVVAPAWPAQLFSLSQGECEQPNVACYEVKLEQPAFLAGAFAAWSTRTGVLGHLSGERVGPGLKGCEAFISGARYANPDVTVLSTFCGHQHDPDLAARAIAAHAAGRVDIVFTMLGAGREGAIDACRELGIKQIGDGADWCAIHPDVFIASAVADTAWCTRQAVVDLMEGHFAGARRRSVGLSCGEGGVPANESAVCRLSMAPDTSPGIRAKVDALAELIVAGKIQVM
ncbi:BMP family ABC transporter substrate-binding protein [soil metagenome]